MPSSGALIPPEDESQPHGECAWKPLKPRATESILEAVAALLNTAAAAARLPQHTDPHTRATQGKKVAEAQVTHSLH